MVNMYPPQLDIANTPSDGEQILFEKLKASKNGANWVAMHSLDIFPKSMAGQAEADFVVFAPGFGILVVEVKAHREVRVTNREWYLSGKKAERSPVKQANRAVFFLKKYLEDRGFSLATIPISFVVWFTHIPAGKIPQASEVNPAGFLSAEDLNTDPVDVLTRALTANAAALNKKIGPKTAIWEELSKAVNVVSPNFEVRMSPRAREKEVNQWLDSAIEQQIELVKVLDNVDATVVQGIAGTGKTHIAIHEAKKAANKSEMVLFVCYNRLLADFLETQFVEHPRVQVFTMQKLLIEISGLQVPSNPSAHWWLNELPEAAITAIENSDFFAAFDVLVIDEAQDVATEKNLEILSLVLADGFQKSKIRVFGDFKNQGIYMSGEVALANLKKAIAGLLEASPLDVNCRNTEDLGTEIMSFLDDLDAYSGYRRQDEGLGMTGLVTPAGKDVTPYFLQELARLQKIFSPGQIVVLSSSRENIDKLGVAIKEPKSPLSFPKANSVRFGTMQEFKGLEALAIVMVEFENTVTPSWQNFYVGATRATQSLSFVIPETVIPKVQERK